MAIEEKQDNRVEYKEKESSVKNKILKYLGRLLLLVFETVLIVAVAVYGVMYILAKGPSPTAQKMFVMSVRETSAIGFLADLFFSDEEIAEIEAGRGNEEFTETDTSLININVADNTDENGVAHADEWGLIDEDGDGIIIEPVKGAGYSGYMMVVLDPSRVIMGSIPKSYDIKGYTVEEMVKEYDAVAGINAGGFEDRNGQGDGSTPNSLVVVDGEIYFGWKGVGEGFVGFDSNHIMHVGCQHSEEIIASDIQYGVCFGPVLIANGVPVDPESLRSGVNPRTAIGQRSDGAVLMLVIDGRQVISLGATYQDLMEIMLEYGAVNACNLDGGSSSLMWYEDAYVNNCASVIGIRPVPTSFLVLKEGVNSND